jgi:hypothetical protein
MGLADVWTVMELGDYVYWVERGGNAARAVPKAGGNVIDLATNIQSPWTLTHDDEFIYVADLGGGRIVRIDPLTTAQ